MSKISFLLGAAAGYVLGARAGRQRYEQIRSGAAKAWQSQPVQQQVLPLELVQQVPLLA